jgi:hypothetical protein
VHVKLQSCRHRSPFADAAPHVTICALKLGVMCSLQARGSKLILLRGPPAQQLPLFWKEHRVTDLVFESDTGDEPAMMH